VRVSLCVLALTIPLGCGSSDVPVVPPSGGFVAAGGSSGQGGGGGIGGFAGQGGAGGIGGVGGIGGFAGQGGAGGIGGFAGQGGAGGGGGIGGFAGQGGAGGIGEIASRGGPCLDIGLVDPEYGGQWPQGAPSPSPHTIDAMDMEHWYSERYPTQGGMRIVSFGKDYFLNDGSMWGSGAGSASYGILTVNEITRDGSTIRYHMNTDDLIVRRTDYDSGDHAANYRLETIEDVALVAEYGSTLGTITTEALIAGDEPANYIDGRFHFLSAPLCSIVPITISYTLLDGETFDEDLFLGEFEFISYTLIEFAADRE
jgi:hypothetical protein